MRWVGQFLGYCLWTGEAAQIPVLPSVFKQLLDNHIQWRDLMLDAPSVYTGYLKLLVSTHATPLQRDIQGCS